MLPHGGSMLRVRVIPSRVMVLLAHFRVTHRSESSMGHYPCGQTYFPMPNDLSLSLAFSTGEIRCLSCSVITHYPNKTLLHRKLPINKEAMQM